MLPWRSIRKHLTCRGESQSQADDDVARAFFQMSTVVSLVLLVLLIIPLSVEKSDSAISHSLSF